MNDFLRYLFAPVRLVIALLLFLLMTVVFLIASVLYPHASRDYKEAIFSLLRFVRNGIDSY